MSSRTKSAYDAFAEHYDSDANPLITLEHTRVVHAVDPHRGEKILDAACGTGNYITDFLTAGAEVVGCDFSEGMLAIARRKHPSVQLDVGDLNNPLPYGTGAFSKVNCSQALKHIAQLGMPIREFARVVQPLGRVVFSVTHPNMTWDGFEMSSSPTFVIGEETDVFQHTFDDYKTAITTAGLVLDGIEDVAIDESIHSMLLPESYELVRGRPMVAIVVMTKP